MTNSPNLNHNFESFCFALISSKSSPFSFCFSNFYVPVISRFRIKGKSRKAFDIFSTKSVFLLNFDFGGCSLAPPPPGCARAFQNVWLSDSFPEFLTG
jgi:hypothetical protein